jgi:hypothetical protein
VSRKASAEVAEARAAEDEARLQAAWATMQQR